MDEQYKKYDEIVGELQKDPKGLLYVLRQVAPTLYVVARINMKLLPLIEYGEIHITEYIKNKKVSRAEGIPKIGELVDG